MAAVPEWKSASNKVAFARNLHCIFKQETLSKFFSKQGWWNIGSK